MAPCATTFPPTKLQIGFRYHSAAGIKRNIRYMADLQFSFSNIAACSPLQAALFCRKQVFRKTFKKIENNC